MMCKQHLNDGTCKVTVELPAAAGAEHGHPGGAFDDWSPTATPMTRVKDGDFRAVVVLGGSRSRRFRDLLDGTRWENDWTGDACVPNDYGRDDSVVTP